MRKLAKWSKSIFFKTLEINQSLAITQEVSLQEKWLALSNNRELSALSPTALSQLGGSPKSQQSRISVKPAICQPLPVAKLSWRSSKASFTENCQHSARSSQFPGNGNCLSSGQPGVVITIRVNNKMTENYKRKSWREGCPGGGSGRLCHIPGKLEGHGYV